VVRLGVVTDTHIPDRMRHLPQAALDRLAGVDAILHAGDVSTRGVCWRRWAKLRRYTRWAATAT
jgi:predicted phosphodiesterase